MGIIHSDCSRINQDIQITQEKESELYYNLVSHDFRLGYSNKSYSLPLKSISFNLNEIGFDDEKMKDENYPNQYISIQCTFKNKLNPEELIQRENYLVRSIYNPHLKIRSQILKEQVKNHLIETKKSKPNLNVIFMVMDSLSRFNFMNLMPKLYQYFSSHQFNSNEESIKELPNQGFRSFQFKRYFYFNYFIFFIYLFFFFNYFISHSLFLNNYSY